MIVSTLTESCYFTFCVLLGSIIRMIAAAVHIETAQISKYINKSWDINRFLKSFSSTEKVVITFNCLFLFPITVDFLNTFTCWYVHVFVFVINSYMRIGIITSWETVLITSCVDSENIFTICKTSQSVIDMVIRHRCQFDPCQSFCADTKVPHCPECAQ